MLHHPIFLKKIRVALESRTLIWVPLLQAMTLKDKLYISSFTIKLAKLFFDPNLFTTEIFLVSSLQKTQKLFAFPILHFAQPSVSERPYHLHKWLN